MRFINSVFDLKDWDYIVVQKLSDMLWLRPGVVLARLQLRVLLVSGGTARYSFSIAGGFAGSTGLKYSYLVDAILTPRE